MGSGIFYLLKERKFLPFFMTQFFGAFNDNAFKLAMLTTISYHLTHTQALSEYYQAMAGALFILPFFLFSATAGQLADKYDKTRIIRLIKSAEVVLMILGSFALYYGNIFWMMFTLTGMGIHSTFFGPIKYAILPDQLPKEGLLGATGLVEASTFIAILLGSTLGTLAIGSSNAKPYVAVFMTILFAILGLIASLFIPKTPSSTSNLKIDFRFWNATFTILKEATKHSGMLMAILVISWFWFIGTILLTKLPDYTHYVLGADTKVFALFLALFSIGIALGSLMANFISHGQLNLSIVPFAMLGFSCFSFDLYWASPQNSTREILLGVSEFFTYFLHWRIAFDLLILAFSSGIFVVQLYTYLQVTSPPANRARIIAANNIYNALFMVLATVIMMIALHFSASIPQIFLIPSLVNAVVALLVWFFLKRAI